MMLQGRFAGLFVLLLLITGTARATAPTGDVTPAGPAVRQEKAPPSASASFSRLQQALAACPAAPPGSAPAASNQDSAVAPAWIPVNLQRLPPPEQALRDSAPPVTVDAWLTSNAAEDEEAGLAVTFRLHLTAPDTGFSEPVTGIRVMLLPSFLTGDTGTVFEREIEALYPGNPVELAWELPSRWPAGQIISFRIQIETEQGAKSTAGELPVPALAETWSTHGPFGGEVYSIAAKPQSGSIVYAGSANGGIFYSNDAGISYMNLKSDIASIWFISFDPKNLSIMYLACDSGESGTRGGIWKSTDGGAAWTQINSGLPASPRAWTVAVNPQTSTTLYAGLVQGFYKSTNSGQNWTWKSNGFATSNIFSMATDPSNPNTIWAGTAASGVYRSTDAGESWFQRTSGLGNASVFALALRPQLSSTIYAAVYGNGVYASTDSGQNWAPRNTGLGGQNCTNIYFDPQNSSTLYVCTGGGGIFKSTNLGGNWTPVNTGLGNLVINAMSPGSSSMSRMTAASNGGIYFSENGGTNWNTANFGESQAALATDPQNAQLAYAATPGGVYKTGNAGLSWTDSNTGLPEEYLALNCIALHPQSPSTLYIGTLYEGVYYSPNAGTTWSKISHSIPANNIWSVALHPALANTCYAGSYNYGIYKTTNGGTNWTAVNSGIGTTNPVYTIAVAPATAETVYAGTSAGVYKSTNGGGAWLLKNTGLPAFTVYWITIDPSAESTVYACTMGGGIAKSTNGGTNWSPVNTGLTNLFVSSVVVDPANGNNLFASTFGSGVFQSTNGGTNWSAMNNGLGDWMVFGLARSRQTPYLLYAATSTCIYQTPTGTPCTAPSITVHPQSTVINYNQTATLSVTATGTEPLQYQWYQGTSPSTATPVNGATLSSFQTPALTQTTSYWVKVTNTCNSANSNTATVTVNPCTPPSITSHPASQTITSGQQASLSVTATGTAPLSYQWYQGSSPNTATPVGGATGSSFQTPALTQNTSYWVRVTNACNSANSNTATITISAPPPPPVITVHPASQIFSNGRTVTLSVTATGSGLAYQWYNGNTGDTSKPQTNGNQASFTTPALTSAANYWARVTNGGGSANSNTASLLVVQSFIAATAHTSGGTNWHSDVDLFNYGAADAAVRIFLLRIGSNNSWPTSVLVTVPKGKSLQLQDILASTFTSGNAALGFSTSSSTVLINSRFYNTVAAPGGGTMTFGMFLPSTTPAQALRGDGSSRGLFHFLRASTAFRSNIGFASGSGFNIDLEILLFEDGVQLGRLTLRLKPFEHMQYTNIFRAITQANIEKGTAQIRVLTANGEVHSYAMLIDNRTSDPVYLLPDIR